MTEPSRIIDRSSNESKVIFANPPKSLIRDDLTIEIQNKPVMSLALDLLTPLSKNKEITLKARGDLIANAVTVANIITNNLMKGKARIYKVSVDSKPLREMVKMESSINIILRV